MDSIRLTRMSRTKLFLTIFVLLLGTIESSLANKSCKSTVMKIVMRQCSDATLRPQRDSTDGALTIEKSLSSLDYKRLPKMDTLPVTQGDSLGFELTETELDELLDEIYERLGRNPTPGGDETKNRTKHLFLEIAARCCQNEAECLREKIIECP